jgi:acyl carrier protein
MNNFEKIELCNVDPDDISDLLVKVEKSFGCKFGNTELKDVKTFGELCNIITSKVPGENSNDCTTQQAFYKLRSAIAGVLHLDKASLTPDSALQNILPRNIRRQSIKAIEKELGFKTNMLRPKHSVARILVIVLLASFVWLFVFWQAGLIGLAFAIICLSLAAKFGNELELQTVGEFADKISREHYLKSRRIPTTANKKEIAQKVKELFIGELGLEQSKLKRQSSFV